MRPAPRDPRRATALAALLLVAWVGWFVAPGLAPGRTLLGTDLLGRFPPWSDARPAGWESANPMLFDQATQFFPWRTLTRALAREGLPPLWNPFAGAGAPLLADYQSAPYAPSQMAVAGLPWTVAPAVSAALRLLVAALGMLLLLRALGLGAPAALFGALAFVGSGAVTILLYHPNSDVVCWLPLATWLSLRVARCGGGVEGAALALVLGAQYLGGHPETSVFVVGVALLGFALGLATRGPAERAAAPVARALGVVVAAHALGVLLAAVQIVPFAEYLRVSNVVGERTTTSTILPPAAALGLVAPGAYGSPLRPNTYFGPGNYHDVAMQYAGLVTLVLALAGVARWVGRRRAGAPRDGLDAWTAVATGLALLSLLVIYPTPVSWLVRRVPGLRIVHGLVGWTVLDCFALSLLGALAVEPARPRPAAGAADGPPPPPSPARRTPRGAVVLAAIVGLAALGALAGGLLVLPALRDQLLSMGARVVRARYDPAVAPLPVGHYLAKLPAILETVRGALLVTGALGAATAALLLARRRLTAAWFAALAVALLAVDLSHFGRGYVPAIDAADALPRGRWEALLTGADVRRVLPTGRALPPNTLTLWGVEDFRDYDAIETRTHDRYVAPPGPVAALRRPFASYRRELVDAAGVDVVVAERPLADAGLAPLADSARALGAGSSLFYYRNLRAWPHAFVVEDARRTPADSALAATAEEARGAVLAPGPAGDTLALPKAAVLGEAWSGRDVAGRTAWAAVARLHKGLVPARRERGGPARDGWLGDAAAARTRLWRDEPVYRVVAGRAIESGRLVRGPLAVRGAVLAPLGGWLVILDQDFPGWRVTVDGAAGEPARAFGLFRAVRLGPGPHTVVWSYEPASYALGLGLSLVSLAASLVWLALASASASQPRRSSSGGTLER